MSVGRPRTALLRTSAATDVVRSGGKIAITGLGDIYEKNITKATQFKYRAEVVKVETIGSSSYTPTASTTYIVEISDVGSRREGIPGSRVPRKYVYTTPATITDIGATAALQREYIHGKLITKINDDTSNNVVAVTLATGTGFTITDDAGYFPAKSAGGQYPRGGKTTIRVSRDVNGLGFSDSADRTVTTDATYQFGEGSRMDDDIPVISAYFGANIVAGEFDAPLTVAGLGAVSGQQYDAFFFEHLVRASIPTTTGFDGYRIESAGIWVDNGRGTATTNLAGFKAFERVAQKVLFSVYKSDPSAIIEWFDKGYTMQANPGITPYTGTIAGDADVMKFFSTPYGTFLEQYNINAQTIFAPLIGDTGLRIEQDVNATDGAHYCGSTTAFGPSSFIVGKTGFSVVARVNAGDWTDAFFMIGFRNKAAYAADYTTYDDLAAIGTQVSAAGDFVATQGNINNGTTVETVSASTVAADSTSVEFRLKVSLAGAVTAYRDGVSFPIYSAGTTALVLTAGDEMIPFFQFINRNSSASTLTLNNFVAVADDFWKIDA